VKAEKMAGRRTFFMVIRFFDKGTGPGYLAQSPIRVINRDEKEFLHENTSQNMVEPNKKLPLPRILKTFGFVAT
jgi:hypothetical protein